MNEIASERKFKFVNFIAKQRALALFLLIVVFCLAFSLILPKTFGTLDNFALILLNMSAESMILVAICLILISGEIDLSLGSIMVLGGILCGRFMILGHMPTVLAILLPLLISLVAGIINGIIVAKLNVVSFIATLATGMIYLGIAIMLAGTGWTDFPDPVFKALGQSKIFGLIQLPVVYMIVIIALFAFAIAKTRFFRQYYYIGGNTKAAVLSGINIDRMRVISFVISAFLGCMAGIVTAMRFNSAMPSVGAGVELRAVTAAVIGGVSFTGGTGTMVGAAMGALFVACLNNALMAIKLNANLQFSVTGLVLILAIVVDIIVSRKNK